MLSGARPAAFGGRMLLHAPSPDVRTVPAAIGCWTGRCVDRRRRRTGAYGAERKDENKFGGGEDTLCGSRLLRLIGYAEERPWIFHGHKVNVSG
jgi:hypothetical protein